MFFKKKIAVLIILPEFKTSNDIENWNYYVNKAYELYNIYPYDEKDKICILQKWAIGYVAWIKMIDYLQLSNVNVYFLRTDYRLKDEPYKIENNIINIQFNYDCGHIIYKTLYTLKILINDNYDYYIRGNVNSIIDLYALSKFVEELPKDNIFTSPFFEGNSYPFGYFMLISNNIAKYLITIPCESTNRWFNEDTADDYELTNVILKKFNYYPLSECEYPLIHNKHFKDLLKTINKYGIHFCRNNTIEDSISIINKIKKCSNTIFLYRIREIIDNNYVLIYKEILKHIWNNVVSDKYNDLIIFNELNYLVPHNEYERDEQLLVSKYINPNDIVLELGARYGSVSCIINKILNNKLNQVSVEPDNTVISTLHKNKLLNKCNFHIYHGIITNNNKYNKLIINGYGSTIDMDNTDTTSTSITVECISLIDLQEKYNLKFNTLVIDCEGFLEIFLNENKDLYTQINKIIFECDRPDICNYNAIKTELIKHNFKMIENGFHCVFIK
jgi:FkbM family methyltransferase